MTGDFLTLADHAKRLGPDGKHARIVEMLDQSNPMLDDVPFIESNSPDGHVTTVRTGLPTPIWRKLYQGVPNSRSTTAQVTEGVAMMEDRSHVDVDLAKRAGELGAFRISEAKPHFEGMSQEMMSTFIYGNSSTAPEEFLGLAPRYSSLSAANAQNIIDAGGLGSDNTSIWLIVWGMDTVHGIFPQGSQAGLLHEDLGVIDVLDTNGNPFRAYADRWQWKTGLVLRDWRFAVRICNIDISALTTESSAADLTKLMIKATKRIPKGGMGRAVWYMNRTVEQMLDIQRYNNVGSGGGVTYQNVDGVEMMYFRGRPIKTVDAILENETRVT